MHSCLKRSKCECIQLRVNIVTSLTCPSLVLGSAVGSIRELFAKIKTIDEKHGKFDFALCVGDFFGPPKSAEEEYQKDHEIVQLLEGHLEGLVVFLAVYIPPTQYKLLFQPRWNAISCKGNTHYQCLSSKSSPRLAVL